MVSCALSLSPTGFPKIPTVVKGMLAYSMIRNGYHLSQLPEKDTSWSGGEHILLVDKVVAYPFACVITCGLLPFKIVHDLERLEYWTRKIPLPRSLTMQNISDVLMK